jgi:hypothetical protein
MENESMDITQKPAEPVRCYRFNPVTGADANDLGANLSRAQRRELKAMIRSGASFYWVSYPAGNSWSRIERSNFAFIMQVANQSVEWIDAKAGE